MTLTAKISDKIYYSTEITNDFAKENKAVCIGCGAELLFHRNIAGVKTQHWAHKTDCPFETEPETEEHIFLKKYLYEKIIAEKKYLPDSVFIDNQKPDIYIEDKNKKIAIEVQCSRISYEDFINRTKDYTKKGIYVLWILGQKYFKSGSINRKRISEVEKKLHYLYKGKIYYHDELEIIYPQIGAYHFELCKGYKDEFNDYGGYEYILKKTKKLIRLHKVRNYLLQYNTCEDYGETYLISDFTWNQSRGDKE